MSDTNRPYESLTDGEIFARLERAREALRQSMADEALRVAAENAPLLPSEPEDAASRYERVLDERRARRVN